MTLSKIQKKSGFSLVETLVAIAILMIAVVGPMTLAWSSIAASNDARNEITATYLAQESLEYVRNIRDGIIVNNYTSGTTDITSGTTDEFPGAALVDCYTTSDCDISPNQPSPIIACTSGSGLTLTNGDIVCPLYTVVADGYKVYTSASIFGGIPSIFYRSTKITPGVSGDEYIVTTTVHWKNHNRDRIIRLSTVLYNY